MYFLFLTPTVSKWSMVTDDTYLLDVEFCLWKITQNGLKVVTFIFKAKQDPAFGKKKKKKKKKKKQITL